MARSRAFNLTAEINLRGPTNIGNIVSDIRRQLTGITVDITPRINAQAMRNVTTLNTNLQTLNRTFQQTQRSAADATTAIRNFGQAINGIGNAQRTLTQAAAATQTLNQRATTAATNLGNASTQMAEFGRQSAIAVRRFAAFSLVTSAIYSFTGALSQGIKAFLDFDKEFVRLQQVTGQSAAGLKDLSSQISSLSISLGVSSSELTTVSVTLAQAGLSARDTAKALKALALSSLAPSFDDMNQTVEGSIALMRQFGIGAGDLESALGSINAVAAQFAVEASDLIVAIQRTGGVFATASKGVSEGKDALNEFLAVFTSIRATTRESAETIATGLRTIFTRIQRADTVDALKQLGIELRDMEGKFVGPYEAVRRLSEGLSKIDPRSAEFAKISEELGGFRQVGKVIPLIQQFAVAQNALAVAQKGSGSLAKDAGTAQLALANQIAKVREEFLSLVRSIGESESFRSMISIALQFASALIKIADAVKIVLPALTAMAAFKGLQALTQFGAGFMGGIRGGARRANGGGYIRAFASGGLVPGQGNTDSVGAMLTPGEFVIRKKAVEAIGANKLYALNRNGGGNIIRRYATAGDVKPNIPEVNTALAAARQEGPFSGKTTSKGLGTIKLAAEKFAAMPDNTPDIFGAAFLSPQGSVTDLQGQLDTGIIADSIKQTKAYKALSLAGRGSVRDKQIAATIQNELQSITKIAEQKGSFKIIAESLSEPVATNIENIILSKITEAVQTGGGILSSQLGTRIDVGGSSEAAKILKQSNIDNIIGNVFEAMVTNAGAPYSDLDRDNANDPWDFPGGLGSTAKNFGNGRLSNIITDTKTRFTASNISSLMTKVKNYETRVLMPQIESLLNQPGIEQAFSTYRLKNQPITPSEELRKVRKASGGSISRFATGGWVRGAYSPQDIAIRAKTLGMTPQQLRAKLEERVGTGPNPNDYKIMPWDIEKLFGLKPSKVPLSKVEQEIDEAQAKKNMRMQRSMEAQGRSLQDYSGSRYRGFEPRRGFASGGSTQDTVPALLTPGEFVINKRAASRIGSSTLHKLNHADKISRFNKGGSVGYIQKFEDGEYVLSREEKKRRREEYKAQQSPSGLGRGELMPKEALTSQVKNIYGKLFQEEVKAIQKFYQQKINEAMKEGKDLLPIKKQAEKTLLDMKIQMEHAANAELKRRSEKMYANTGGRTQLSAGADQMVMAGKPKMTLQNTVPTFYSMGQNVVSGAQSFFGGGGPIPPGGGGLIPPGAGGSSMMAKARQLRAQGLRGPALKAAMAGGGGGGMGGMMGMALTMGGGLAVEGAASLAGGEKTSTGRAISTVGGDVLNYGGMGAMIGSMFGPAGTAVGALAGAALGAVTGLMKLDKANREVAENLAKQKTEMAAETSGKAVSQYSNLSAMETVSEKQKAESRANALAALAATRNKEETLSTTINTNTGAFSDKYNKRIQNIIAGKEGDAGGYERVSKIKKIEQDRDQAIQTYTQETIEANKAGATQAATVLATDMQRTGKSFQELADSMNKTSEGQTEFRQLTQDIAEADATYINYRDSQSAQIQELRKNNRGDEANALQASVNEELDRLRLEIAARSLSENTAAIAAEKMAKEQEKLSKAINRATVSLLKSFGAIDQSFNRTAMVIGQLGNKRSEILTGKKSLTSNQFAERADVFKNPLAYSRQERQGAMDQTKGMFGPIGDVIDNVINTVEDARNTAIRAGVADGGNEPNSEAGRQAAKKSLLESLKNSAGAFGSLGPVLEANIESAFKNAKPEDTLDDIIEKALGPAGEIGQKAMELFGKANEEAAKALGELAQTSQAYADITTKNIARTASLFEMQAGSRLQQQEALGINVTPQEKLNARLVGMSKRLFGEDTDTKLVTGGVNTRNILQTRASLVDEQNKLKQQQAGMEQRALAGGPQEQKDLRDFQTRLAAVNNRLETMDTELQNLPQVLEQSIGDLIGEMQKRVSMLEARKEAGAGFAEKLVTSTPQELRDLNNTYALLNNTLRGNITTINDSRVAQEAYFQALREGKNPQEAMNEAQGAFANENKKALSMFNELAQVSGLQGPEMDKMRADLIENLAASTGQNNNPLIQNILAQLREDPQKRAERDPVLVALKGQAEALREEQVRAVEAANAIDRNKQAELLTQVAQKILEAFTNVATMIQSALEAVAQATGTTVLGGQQAGGTATATTAPTNTNKPQGANQQQPNAPTVPVHPQTGQPLTPGQQAMVELGIPLPPVPGAAPAAAAAAPAAGGGAINLAPINVNARPNDAATGLLPGSRVGAARPGTIGGISLTQQASNARVERKKRTRERQLRASDGPITDANRYIRQAQALGDSSVADRAVQRQLDKENREGAFKDTGIRGLEDAQAGFRQAQSSGIGVGDATRNVLRSQREEARLARGANFSRQQEEKRKQFDYQRKFGPAIRAGLMPRNYKDFERQQQGNAGPAGPGPAGGVGVPMAAPAAPVAGAAGVPVAGAGAAPGAPGAPGAGAAPGAPGAAGAAPALSPEVNKFLQSLTAQVNGFGKYVDQLANIKSIQVEGNFKHEGKVEVVVTGAAALDMFSSTIQEKIDKSISDAIKTLKIDTNGSIISNIGQPQTTEANPSESSEY